MIEYKTGETSDVVDIAKLHADNWQTYYRGALKDKYLDNEVHQERLLAWQDRLDKMDENEFLLTAYFNDSLIGFAYTYLDYDDYGSYLDNLHVSPAIQGKGVGRELMTRSAQWLIDQDSENPYYLWVLDTNVSAIRFYDKIGGVNSGTDMHTMPDGSECSCFRYIWNNLDNLASPIPAI